MICYKCIARGRSGVCVRRACSRKWSLWKLLVCFYVCC